MIAITTAFFIGFINLLYFIVIVKGHPLRPSADDIVRVRGVRLTSEKFAAGILVYFIGALSLVNWVYFMSSGFQSLLPRGSYSWLHLTLQLVVAVYLLVAGHAVLRAWKRHTTIFFTSLCAVFFVSIFSLATQGGELLRFDLHVFSTVVQIIGSVFSAAIFSVGMIFSEANP